MPAIYKNGKNYSGGAIVDSALSSTSTNPVQNKVVKQALDGLILNFANYYNKTEVDSIVNAIKNSRFEAVSTLPTTDIKTNVIYLVPKSPTQTNNAKDEYINLDGTSSGWEKIGDTEIDLSGYVTTNALNTALSDYTTTTDLTTLLNNKVDKVSGKGLSTNDYTNEEKQKNADNASAIEDLQEDISTSLTATGNPLTIESSESNLVECTAEVEAVQEGSGDPSPTNVRPIIGQTEVVIEDVGKNLCPINNINGTLYQNIRCYLPQGTYTISVEATSTDTDTNICIAILLDKNADTIRQLNFSRGRRNYNVFTTTKDVYSINFYASDNYVHSTNDTFAFNDIQIEPGTTATDYEPYKGKTYTIQLGDTIYGGELDVLTGKLRVDRGYISDLSSLSWELQGTGSDGGAVFYTIVENKKNSATKGICSSLQTMFYDGWASTRKGTINLGHSTKAIFASIEGITTVEDFKTTVTGQTLVYELATPYTIQLTPQQIRLLKGTNHLSCNAKDLSIKYYPDNVLGQLKGDIEDEYDGNPKLPEVTSVDNGNILTVIEGAWGKATPESGLPPVTSTDNGKFLRVVNGSWVADTVPSAESQSF